MKLIVGLAVILIVSWLLTTYDKMVDEEIKWQERNKSWNHWTPRRPFISKKQAEELAKIDAKRKRNY